MKRIAVLLSTVLALIAAVGGGLATAPHADAGATPATSYHAKPKLAMVGVHYFAHRFWNFDYDPNAHTVDNPVTIIFVSNHVQVTTHVYNELCTYAKMCGHGDDMTLRGWGPALSGGSNTEWTSVSSGRKSAKGCWNNCDSHADVHIRVYGPTGRQGTEVYQGGYGYDPYYVVATVHFDRSEGTSQETFGYSDQARGLLVRYMVSKHAWRYLGSQYVSGTVCHWWVDSKHYCDSNGFANVISIDG